MKRDHVNYFYVGLMVLVALGLLLATLFAITGRSGAKDRYFTFYQNVSGLGFGTAVFYQGFRIGQVESIQPEQSAGKTRFRVDFSVNRGWQIPNASTATLMSSGLLSDVFVGLSEGAGPGLLAAGSEIAGREGGDIFASVNMLAGEITTLTQTQISPLLRKLGSSVDAISDSVQSGAPTIVDDTVVLLKQLNEGAASVNAILGPNNRGNVARLLEAGAKTAENASALSASLQQTRSSLDNALQEIENTTTQIGPDLQASMTDLRATLATLAQRVDAITYNLDSASRHFDEFGREIRKNPNRLLFNPVDDDDIKGPK
jgi:phospholipid/cholesterol/gamma-HCH transport system substrate-binding protein